jgi:beta-glucanase (GH16 family)
LFCGVFAVKGDEGAMHAPTGYWNLVWAQEFDEGYINPNIWAFEIGNGHAQGIPGWGNNELQWYSDRNAFVEHGCLVIEARKETVRDEYGVYHYTSARLTTKGKFAVRYGRIEIRAKLPEGRGIWPALWMLGANIDQVRWPECGEIDIMEMLGHDPYTVYAHVHGPGYFGGTSLGDAYRLPPNAPSFSEAFYIFAIEWQEDEIRWYVNDVLYFTFNKETLDKMNFEWLKQHGMEWAYPATKIYRWVFDQEFFLVLNVAVGGRWPGYPDKTTTFPQRMYVDYIRIFERIPGGSDG